MVLPGAQASLGFQTIAVLTDSFEKLPSSSQFIHLASLMLTALAIIFLMAPAAFHRIVEAGEDTERFYHTASRFLILAMVPLALGICGDSFVVALGVLGSNGLALGLALSALALFYLGAVVKSNFQKLA